MKGRTERTFTPDEITAIRTKVREIMEREGLSQADIARGSGVAYGTLTGWLAGTYQGNNDRIAGEVQIWITARDENRRAATLVPRVPGYQATPSSEEFIQTLRFAQMMPEISVIAGAPGLGKTTSIREYQRSNPNVWVLTLDPSSGGVHGMMVELCETLGIQERVPNRLARAIGRKVEGTGGLIVIDEAQHAKTSALDQMRSFYDRYGVGIALVGNETVYDRLEGEGKKKSFAQLFSRIGVRITRSKPQAGDICAILAGWGITDAEETRFLKGIGARPGALRSVTKTLQLASVLAAGSGEARDIRHIKTAFTRLNDVTSVG